MTPNEAYEEATKIVCPAASGQENDPSGQSFQAFHRRVADFGIINSLAQVVLKCTCPGVPDIYQGCEGWDLSLVDPDNRRPVDFTVPSAGAGYADAPACRDDWPDLWENRYDARIKLWLVHTLLTERNQHPELFAQGHYIPLQVEGRYKKHVLAFARRYEQTWYVWCVPLGMAQLGTPANGCCFPFDWEDTRVMLPAEAPDQWKHRLLNTEGKATEDGIAVADLFGTFTAGRAHLGKTTHRTQCGYSDADYRRCLLRSVLAISDRRQHTFADFLSRSQQTYWQVLPLNPVGAECGYSPYSATSAMAGNPLLLSPELLAQDGFLDEADLACLPAALTHHVDYETVSRLKKALLTKA